MLHSVKKILSSTLVTVNTMNEIAIRGALYGALVGDALGVPYEFHLFDIPARVNIEMQPPVGFRRSHIDTPIGTYSDDGALMLALMDSLTDFESLHLVDFATNMVGFMNRGSYAVGERIFDIGFQTRQGLKEFEAGTHPSKSGPKDERDNGNGSLMRVLPVAFLIVSDEETIRIAMEQSLPTHGHIRSQLVCALYALVAKNVLAGLPLLDSLNAAMNSMEALDSEHHDELELIYNAGDKLGEGTGYVVDCFWSAFDCLRNTGSYEECVQAAVWLGNDTDTTACVAGGLAGAYYGFYAIPKRWRDVLRGKDLVEHILKRYLQASNLL